MKNLKPRTLKICHVTSVHKRYDSRIFQKQCVSLAKHGYKVFLIVNDEKPSEINQNVNIVSSNIKTKNRLQRMFYSLKILEAQACKIDAQIYHLHDPELLPLAYKLKKRGKTVIFDSHEDYPLTMLAKHWIPKFLRPLVGMFYGAIEKFVVSKLDGAITCYHWTEDRYLAYNSNVRMILNFPIVNETWLNNEIDYNQRTISFAGSITRQWCHKNLLKALDKVSNITYNLAGKIPENYHKELTNMKSWQKVHYYGFVSQKDVFEKVYSKSSIGIALLDYIPQCKGKIGNLSNTKFFEYMLLGLPLICTDFKLWKEIIEKENCGICVEPHNIDQITDALNYLLDNPKIAKKMGKNGQKAVVSKYNWKNEEKKLFELYNDLSGNNAN